MLDFGDFPKPARFLWTVFPAYGHRRHYRRDHCKAPALFAGARRFHRCIESEDICLKLGAIDHGDGRRGFLKTR
jgi:hypothetical protein